ncbi:hypothetical protein COU53_00115, partial [Candidatus Pacearchaeota archaeon CG10_big_fil_rev_8_21_14_0_10_30_48]
MKKSVITFIVLIALVVSVVSVVNLVNKGSPIQLSPIDGLVANYTFNDGDGKDSSGNGLNGWPIGVSYIEEGVKGKAAIFGGDGDRIAIADNNLLDLNSFTLSGWFYFQDDIGSARLIAKEFDNTKWDYRLITLDNGVLNFQDALLVQINKANGGILQVQVNNALKDYKNKWVFLSSTYDGNNLILYVDGVEIGRISGATAIKNSGAGLGIGAGVSGNAPFKGKIDEVKIYNKALNDEKIKELYILGILPWCGDGIINEGIFRGELEICDGGSQNCTTSNGQQGTQTCRSDCNGWNSCVINEINNNSFPFEFGIIDSNETNRIQNDYVYLNNVQLATSTEDIAVLYQNNKSTCSQNQFLGYGKDYDDKLAISSGNTLTFNENVNDYFIASWNTSKGQEGINVSYLMRATYFKEENGVNTTTFQYKNNGVWADAKADAKKNDTFFIGNMEFFTIQSVDRINKEVVVTRIMQTQGSVGFSYLFDKDEN